MVKDCTAKEHKNHLVYKVKCPEEGCNESYKGEISRRLEERAKDHAGRDHKSHFFTHTLESGHQSITIDNFTVLFNDNRLSNYYRRKTTRR